MSEIYGTLLAMTNVDNSFVEINGIVVERVGELVWEASHKDRRIMSTIRRMTIHLTILSQDVQLDLFRDPP